MKGAELLRIVEKYDRAVDKQEAAAIKRINKRLLEALQSIDTQLADYYSGLAAQGSLAAQMQVRRSEELAALLGQIEPTQDSFYQSEFDSLLRTSNAAGTELANELLTSYGAQSAVSSFTTIPYAAIANQASEGLKRLSNHTNTFRNQASAVIEQGLIQGKGAKWMQRQLKQQMTGITAKKAEDIARTESSSAFNAAAEQRYAAVDIKYGQLLITPSQRVCPFCAGRNGAVFQLGKLRVPLHVRCRCMIIPWSKEWQKAGLTDDAFIIDYHNKGIAELRKNGMQPKYTEQAPFEKSNKLPAPKVVWTPRGKTALLETPPKSKATNTKPKSADDFIKLGKSSQSDALKSIERVVPDKAEIRRLTKVHEANKAAMASGGYKDPEKLKAFFDSEKALQTAINGDTTAEIKAFESLRQKLIKSGDDKSAKQWAKTISIDRAASGKRTSKKIRTELAEFYRMVGGKVQGSLRKITLTSDRAYASSTGVINIGSQDNERRAKQVLFHEAGHHIEFADKRFYIAADEWMRSRASSQTPKKLSKLTSGTKYNDSEVALPGDFINPYMGKVYSIDSTEVISMGIEHFADPESMRLLYRKDPELFQFILGVISSD